MENATPKQAMPMAQDTEKSDATQEETPENASEVTTETTDETQDKSSSTEQIDYAAELATEEGRGKPDPLKAKEAFKKRQEQREGGTEEDDKPLTRREANELLVKAASQNQKTFQEQEAARIAKGLSSNETEAKAILAKWNNRIFPEGLSLQEQIEEMHAAVNRKRLIGKNKELARALQAQDGVSSDTASTHHDALPGSAPKLNAASPLKDFKFDSQKKLYFKKLSSGKTMWVNPKPVPGQRKTWLE
jgi:hypothetical protein